MTNTDVQMTHPDAPVTRPGFHVTPEGRVIGAADVTWEWESPEDERTGGVTEVAGVPVVESGGGGPPQHPDERTAFVSPSMHEDLRKEAGMGGGQAGNGGVGRGGQPPGGAAAPAVTTRVDEDGNKRTHEHEINVEGTLTHEGVNTLREAIEEAEETMRQLDRS